MVGRLRLSYEMGRQEAMTDVDAYLSKARLLGLDIDITQAGVLTRYGINGDVIDIPDCVKTIPSYLFNNLHDVKDEFMRGGDKKVVIHGGRGLEEISVENRDVFMLGRAGTYQVQQCGWYKLIQKLAKRVECGSEEMLSATLSGIKATNKNDYMLDITAGPGCISRNNAYKLAKHAGYGVIHAELGIGESEFISLVHENLIGLIRHEFDRNKYLHMHEIKTRKGLYDVTDADKKLLKDTARLMCETIAEAVDIDTEPAEKADEVYMTLGKDTNLPEKGVLAPVWHMIDEQSKAATVENFKSSLVFNGSSISDAGIERLLDIFRKLYHSGNKCMNPSNESRYRYIGTINMHCTKKIKGEMQRRVYKFKAYTNGRSVLLKNARGRKEEYRPGMVSIHNIDHAKLATIYDNDKDRVIDAEALACRIRDNLYKADGRIMVC